MRGERLFEYWKGIISNISPENYCRTLMLLRDNQNCSHEVKRPTSQHCSTHRSQSDTCRYFPDLEKERSKIIKIIQTLRKSISSSRILNLTTSLQQNWKKKILDESNTKERDYTDVTSYWFAHGRRSSHLQLNEKFLRHIYYTYMLYETITQSEIPKIYYQMSTLWLV